MTDYISQGAGKTVRIRFPGLRNFPEIGEEIAYLQTHLRTEISGDDDYITFIWSNLPVSDETVNRELNKLKYEMPRIEVTFSDE